MPEPWIYSDKDPIDIANDIIVTQRKRIVQLCEDLDNAAAANAAWANLEQKHRTQLEAVTKQANELERKVEVLQTQLDRIHGLVALRPNDR